MTNPTPPDDLPGYDTLPWPDDALAAWMEASTEARVAVRVALREMAEALDRQAAWVSDPANRGRPQIRWPTEPQRPVPWRERAEGSER